MRKLALLLFTITALIGSLDGKNSNDLVSQNIDIIANFSLGELCPESKLNQEKNLKIRSLYIGFNEYLDSFYSNAVDKVILMNDFASTMDLYKIPKEKLVLFLWEPGGAEPSYCDLFSRVYTYNDTLIDGIKYFKFYYPVLMPMSLVIPSFKTKKFCVMVTHTPTKNRIEMVRFFETKPSRDFQLYGFNPIVETKTYQGNIPGDPLSEQKLSLLKKYRFCICFENSFIKGYITEKIFTCFAAGCVPVYLGAPNVEDYIPKECFIDYRNFQNNEELYTFLKTMPEETYQQYIEAIAKYLNSKEAHLFSADHFRKTIFDAAKPETVSVTSSDKSIDYFYQDQ